MNHNILLFSGLFPTIKCYSNNKCYVILFKLEFDFYGNDLNEI